MDTTLDPTVVNLAKAIRQTESGGNFSAKGKSGEHGAYQFTPDTWNATASKYGINVPLEQATPEQQNAVAYNRIKAWKDAGHDVTQIASMWNAGEAEPDAYTGKFGSTTATHVAGDPSSGVNKFGAHYDVPAYAKSVSQAYLTLKGGGQVEADPSNPSSTANETPLEPVPAPTPVSTRVISPVEKTLFGDKGIQLDNPLTEAIQKLPGQEVGKSLGTLGGYMLTALKEKMGLVPKGTTDAYDLSAPTPLQTAGDVAKGTALVGGLAVGAPASIGEAAIQGGVGGALGAGGQAATQTSDNAIPTGEDLKQVGKGAAIGGAVGATTGALVQGFSKLLGAAGTKIQMSEIKPLKADIKDGFDIKNVQKYGLGGSLPTVLEKTESKLTELTGQLNSKLADSDATINLSDVFKDTAASLSGNKLKTFGSNTSVAGALEQLQNEIGEVSGETGGSLSIPDAQLVKQGAGKFGAWQFGKVDPESTARETVYNAFYHQLKTAIEDNSPDGVQEINKQISELIPISNAVIRRIPVAARNNILSLGDLVSLGASAVSPHGLGTTMLNFASKSGAVGDLLSRFAPRLGSIATPASVGAGELAGSLGGGQQ